MLNCNGPLPISMSLKRCRIVTIRIAFDADAFKQCHFQISGSEKILLFCGSLGINALGQVFGPYNLLRVDLGDVRVGCVLFPARASLVGLIYDLGIIL